jgi:DNA repair protein RecN (Recombination protein N)
MLTYLRVRNLAVFRDVEAEFGPGLNVLTGETGAGKSILVDAVGLLLGGRADVDRVRAGGESASVEGQFGMPGPEVIETLRGAGIRVPDDDALVVRRELSADGPNRVFINGQIAPLATLRRMMSHQVALHGQSRHLTLAGRDAQRRFLDGACLEPRLRADLTESWRRLAQMSEARGEHERRLGHAAEKLDWLRFQLAEIDAVAPHPEEDEALRREERLLATAEERATRAARLVAVLMDEDESVASKLARALDDLAALAALDPRLEENLSHLREIGYIVEDVVAGIRSVTPGEEADPGRLAAIQERLVTLQSLIRKHGGSLERVLAFADRARTEIGDLEDGDGMARRLEAEEREAARRYHELACRAGRARRVGARTLATRVERELDGLGLTGGRFAVGVSGEVPASAERPETVARLGGPGGYERIEFLFSASPADRLLPLAKVASGGELSRLMLALHLVSESESTNGSPRTFIFDEVDAGIGGRMARVIGNRLLRAAGKHQVVCVTHLPQIAALARRHLRIAKKVARGRAVTSVAPLEGEARVTELTRMLGEDTAPETARRHAAALLEEAKTTRGSDGRPRKTGARRTTRRSPGGTRWA